MTSRNTVKAAMANYRAYPLDTNGHFIGATDFEAGDDEEAVNVVRSFAGQLPYELWNGSRPVGIVDSDNVVTLTLATSLRNSGADNGR